LPKPNWLLLSQAVDALADKMGTGSGKDGLGGNPKARSELLVALVDSQLTAEGVRADRPLEWERIPDAWWAMVIPDRLMVVDRGRMPAEPQEVTIVDFRASAIRRITDGEVIIYRSVRLRSEAITNMSASASIITESSAPPSIEQYGSPSTGSLGPIFRTGLPGKPTTWHVMEAECRRRYADGERHPNKSTGRESASEWAKALILWLQSAHPTVAPATPKTLTNRLSILLRELQLEGRLKP
jgi:hypothetical protein